MSLRFPISSLPMTWQRSKPYQMKSWSCCRGRIVEQGVKKEILTPPHHEYTDLLLSSVPEMDPDWLDNLLADRKAKGKPSTIMDA